MTPRLYRVTLPVGDIERAAAFYGRVLGIEGERVWAVLLSRIYDVLPLLCPACGGEMSLHLDLPHKPPPLSPARGPPQSDLLTGLLDHTPAFDPAEPDPVPDFEFDQSSPDDFDL